ncbi:cochlin [Arapaima gigas]
MSVMLAVVHLLGLLCLTFGLETSAPIPITCTTRGSDLTEERSLVACPSTCTVRQLIVFGSGIYAAMSSVCGAAIHRGVITPAGGLFRVQKLPDQENYLSSYSNGIVSQTLAKSKESFSVHKLLEHKLILLKHMLFCPPAKKPLKKSPKKIPKKPPSNGNKDCQVDIAMLLDGSYNIGQRRFNLQKSFVSKLVLMLRTGPEGPHMGVVQASETPVTEFFLKNFTQPKELLFAIKEIMFRGGNTNTGKAMMHAIETFFSAEHGVRKGLPRVIVALVDGWPSDSLEEAATRARESGINVFFVSVAKPSSDELGMVQDKDFAQKAVCKDNGFFSFTMPSWFSTTKYVKPLTQRLCSVEQMLCSKTCYNSVNLGFLIDGSSSVGDNNFQLVLDFIASVVRNFEIADTGSRVGAIQFTYEQKMEFDFSEHTDKERALTAIQAIRYLSGGTATGEAITYAISNLFQKAGSGKNFLIIITDGQSYDDVRGPALAAQKEGITVYSVGVAWAPLEDLRAMASEPKESHTFFTREFTGLKQLHPAVAKRICSDYADKN